MNDAHECPVSIYLSSGGGASIGIRQDAKFETDIIPRRTDADVHTTHRRTISET